MRAKTLTILALLFAFFAITANCFASIAVPQANWNEGRTSGAGEIVTGGNWANQPFSIEWDISQSGNVYTYQYTITGPSGPRIPGISHWILSLTDIGDNEFWDDLLFAALNPPNSDDIETKPYTPGPSNPGMPVAGMYGAKFDDFSGMLSIEFSTTHAPVWGDFYSKGGSDSFAYNTGFGSTPSGNFANWIARPNGIDTVPEPTALIVWSLLIGASVVLRRR